MDITKLPPEIIHYIVQFNRHEVFKLAATCKKFNEILGLEHEIYKRSLQPQMKHIILMSPNLFLLMINQYCNRWKEMEKDL
jgi:hypothetical protein